MIHESVHNKLNKPIKFEDMVARIYLDPTGEGE
jgi:hypothetical protein